MKKDAKPAGGAIDAILAAAAEVEATELIDLRVGQYWVVVRTAVGAGLASILRSEAHLHGSRPIAAAGELHRWSPHDLCSLLHSDSPPEGAVGLAAVNALVGPTASALSDEKAITILRERGRDRNVAVIGHFPFVDQLRTDVGELLVFERGANRAEDDLGEEAMDEHLPRADVVAVTATTLLNRTLPSVLDRVRDDAFVMLLGPSTPMTPALFDFGFDVLCGTIVDDPESVVRTVEQGAVTSQITGVRRVCLWRDDRN